MERGSDKHGPRIDDQLEHDVRSMLQGAPVESRASEAREQEGPGDGEIVPDARISGDRGLTDDNVSLRYDEIEGRTELARHLEGSVFPADRDALVASARRMNAPDDLVDRLSRLRDGEYTHTEAVWEALGGRGEPRRP
ncbi:MAG TPA: DUF2795 domain-containing protein [Acidimicrobiales bacterium]|nr:DUF2795 domain-containing protein [Acidimicrobiales bacterium]